MIVYDVFRAVKVNKFNDVLTQIPVNAITFLKPD